MGAAGHAPGAPPVPLAPAPPGAVRPLGPHPDGGSVQITAEALLKAKRHQGFTYLGHLPHRPYPPFLRRIEADPIAVERYFEEPSLRFAAPADVTAVATHPPAPAPSPAARPPSPDPVKTCILSVFTDGTSNDMDVDFPQGTATNVAKLYVLSKKGIVGNTYYDAQYLRGVGTGQGWDVQLGQAVGVGFQERVDLALQWLGQRAAEHPQAAIVVDLFGFSRGAAEAMQLTNSLHDPAVLAAHGLSGRLLSLRFVGLFDPVAERGVPMLDLDVGADLTMHPTHVRTVVSLVAVGEVRQTFNQRSLRVPPPNQTPLDTHRVVSLVPTDEARGSFSQSLRPPTPTYTLQDPVTEDGVAQCCSSDWPGIVASQPLPSAGWHEWRVPGVHSDVGGGYPPEEWIPELLPRPPHDGDSVEDYTCRMKDLEIALGAPERGLIDTPPESRAVVQARVKKIWASHWGNEPPTDLCPEIVGRDNALSRIYLWVMKTQAEKAGVVWKDVESLLPEYKPVIQKLDISHPLHFLHEFSEDPRGLERLMESGAFWQVVVSAMHDSRWSTDVMFDRRKRGMRFCGRRS